MTDDTLDDDEVDRIQDRLAAVRTEVRKRLVGQEAVLDQVLACLLKCRNTLWWLGRRQRRTHVTVYLTGTDRTFHSLFLSIQ